MVTEDQSQVVAFLSSPATHAVGRPRRSPAVMPLLVAQQWRCQGADVRPRNRSWLHEAMLAAILQTVPNIYFELTAAFNAKQPVVALASGQAVVYYRRRTPA